MKRLTWIEAEMLLGLWHLRYLATNQIHRVWYSQRTEDACRKRLSRLGAEGIISSIKLLDSPWRSAWHLGASGLRRLRSLKPGEYPPTKPVRPQFISHMLDTNEVFLHLAGAEFRWGCLPSKWQGSHRAGIRYEYYADYSSRRGLLRPDAIITPTNRNAPRVFLELDRSTECIRARDGRRSIEGKLKAYKSVIERGWYHKVFGDERPAVLLFVLSKDDERARSMALRNRRVRSIQAAVRKILTLRQLGVEICYLKNRAAIRRICSVDGNALERPTRPAEELATSVISSAEVEQLLTFYRWSIEAYRRISSQSRVKGPLRASAAAAGTLLKRLQKEASP